MLGPRSDVVLDPWSGGAIPVGYRAAGLALARAPCSAPHQNSITLISFVTPMTPLCRAASSKAASLWYWRPTRPLSVTQPSSTFTLTSSSGTWVPDHALQDLALKFVIGAPCGAEQVHLELVVDLVHAVGVVRVGDRRAALGEALDPARERGLACGRPHRDLARSMQARVAIEPRDHGFLEQCVVH